MLFNVNKSHCIIFGYYCKRVIECLTLGSARIDWCDFLKYLGVNQTSSTTLTIDTNSLKRSFYAACNSIFSQTATLNELVSFSLKESYCLPILTYACAAISLNPKQAAELNACWNAVYRRIFGFNKWESVRTFIHGLGRLNLHSIFKLRKVKFYHQLCHSANVFIRDLFWIYFVDSSHIDTCYFSVFLPIGKAYTNIYNEFALSIFNKRNYNKY